MEIILSNLQKKTSIPKARILRAVKAAIRKNRDRPFVGPHHRANTRFVPAFLSIVFVGTRRMRTINRKYLKHDYVTDVLTFDLGDGMGEIIICPQVAINNAKANRTTTENEIILYVIHGLLHLAGYDDHSPNGILEMRRMEKELLKGPITC